ncbi:winged helix DNA-binding protein [Mammaliicoccus sp. Dog046]|uniref:winged helix DNA-binding protein n=1 Tax=Mammaliicoccus sp. Dog046 TaxID=3034233 RepID=UPI002B25C9C1|nr:MarR family transcriptional regulator [Mammaliicoccus sp. Dog046]WQK85126.1 winged helix DNA-binding protein [Mammaliicoccus sp. Dog046]
MITNQELQDLDLFDILSERHGIIRTKIESMWNDTHDVHMSSSEWYIMAKVYQHKCNISTITKSVTISRQAVHKSIKQLHQKGLVDIQDVEGNKKEKAIQLTALGEEYFLEVTRQKKMLEQHLIESIGLDNVNKLRDILKMDWDIQN